MRRLVPLLLLLGCAAEPPCDPGAPPAPQLRLLTPSEYDATVADLLPFLVQGSCDDAPQCDLDAESCAGGVCVADPCALHTFVLPAPDGPHASVHAAGSFNDWPAAPADGWAMTWVPSQSLYFGKHVVADGEHQYKFVVDGSEWITDPSNSQVTDDGFGGVNSVLIQTCEGAAPPADGGEFSADFPQPGRSPGYAYDNDADAGLVTSVHVEQYLRAGESIAARALGQRDQLLPCASGCAEDWVRQFGPRALRRPLTDAEVARYVALIEAWPDFDGGVGIALQVLLSSPEFLYRFEVGEPDGDERRLTGHEVASQLSYFLWGSMPDAALFEAAATGALDTPEGIESEARRLLADPRSDAVLGRFGSQWLGVERVLTADKSPALYPQVDDALRHALLEETRRFVVDAIQMGPGGLDELLTAQWGYANAASASIYDVAAGVELGEVDLGPERSGILTQGAVLFANAHSDQSNPVRRGLFVRQTLLCHEIPDPPANAGGVPDVDPDATTRERFQQHSDDPGCASCHQYIDGIGFGFEVFDAVGAVRDTENGGPIETGGVITDLERIGEGTSATFAAAPELGAMLAASEAVPACVSRQAFRWSSGRHERTADDCAVETLARQFVTDGDLTELLVGITQLPHFTRRSP